METMKGLYFLSRVSSSTTRPPRNNPTTKLHQDTARTPGTNGQVSPLRVALCHPQTTATGSPLLVLILLPTEQNTSAIEWQYAASARQAWMTSGQDGRNLPPPPYHSSPASGMASAPLPTTYSRRHDNRHRENQYAPTGWPPDVLRDMDPTTSRTCSSRRHKFGLSSDTFSTTSNSSCPLIVPEQASASIRRLQGRLLQGRVSAPRSVDGRNPVPG